MFLLTPRSEKGQTQTMDEGGLKNGLPEPWEQTPRRHEPYVEGNLKLLDVIDCSSEVMCVRFSADAAHIAVGLLDGTTKIYSAHDCKCLYSLYDDDTVRARLPVTCLRFVPYAEEDKVEHKHYLMCTYASGLVKFWHYTSSAVRQTIKEERQTLASAFSPDASSFVTGGADPQLNVYDAATKTRTMTLEPSDSRDVMNGHRARVFALQYHPRHDHIFISGGWDDTVQFWDDRQKRSIRRLYGPHICGDGLDIDANHDHILTGSWRKDNVLQIWDFPTGQKIKDVPQDRLHGSLLYCAQWLGRENMVCGGCDQNMARVIDRGTLNTMGQLVDLPQAVYCMDNDHHPYRPKIVVGSANRVYFLKVEKKQS